MTALTHLRLTCPLCAESFESQKVMTTNSFGGKRTDFHERAAGTQPLPYLVHVCASCGFAGREHLFSEEIRDGLKEDPTVCDQLREALRTFATRETAGSARYEAAATTLSIMGDDARLIADSYLRAAWCCVDEGDSEAERYFRLKAARGFMDALGGFDVIEKDERAVITYLVGELWRRIGDDAVARFWFDRVPAEIVDPKSQQWVIDAAVQQKGPHPREWFG